MSGNVFLVGHNGFNEIQLVFFEVARHLTASGVFGNDALIAGSSAVDLHIANRLLSNGSFETTRSPLGVLSHATTRLPSLRISSRARISNDFANVPRLSAMGTSETCIIDLDARAKAPMPGIWEIHATVEVINGDKSGKLLLVFPVSHWDSTDFGIPTFLCLNNPSSVTLVGAEFAPIQIPVLSIESLLAAEIVLSARVGKTTSDLVALTDIVADQLQHGQPGPLESDITYGLESAKSQVPKGNGGIRGAIDTKYAEFLAKTRVNAKSAPLRTQQPRQAVAMR